MIRTLVTGGTGFIGKEIVRKLVAESESVRILSRNPVQLRRNERIPGVEYAVGNVFDATSLEQAMEGCDAVINAVQFDNAPFENPAKGLTYERIDGEGTERQVEAAKKKGIKRFVYLSGAGTREGRTEPWFRAKARAEKAVRESGMAWTIFRPSWVYGPEDRSLNKFATMARLTPFVFLIGSGKEKIQPVYVKDLAELVWRSLQNAQSFEKTFEVGGPQELTMKEIARTMLRVMRKRRIILPQPKPLMKLAARFVQFLPGRPLTPDGIDFVTMEEKVETSALLATFGIRMTSLEEGLSHYMRAGTPFLQEEFRRIAA